jgi:cytochrome c-type biogenesis protein CcsB
MLMLDSTFFFYLSAIGYFLGFIFYLLHLIGAPRINRKGLGVGVVAGTGPGTATGGLWLIKETTWGTLATWTTVVAFTSATIGVILRVFELWRVSGFFLPLPVTNSYETFAFFAWVIPLAYLIFEWRYKVKTLGAFAIGLAFLFVALASSPLVADKGAQPLVPALQSYWLVAHVVFTIVGEGFFALAFVAGLLFLWQSWRGVDATALVKLDEVGYKSIAIGFPFFTLGAIIFGMVWAQHAWGRYWGWDPKEVWSLISWLIYALYLHTRVTWGWRDYKTAWLAVIGFVAAIFTWFGVNYVLSGLHSYG